MTQKPDASALRLIDRVHDLDCKTPPTKLRSEYTMTSNHFLDSPQGDKPDKLPDDLRDLEADLRLLKPRSFYAAPVDRPTPRMPTGLLSLTNSGNRTTFVAGLLFGCVLGAVVTSLFVGGNRRSDPAHAQHHSQAGTVERPNSERESSPPHVAREDTQVASLSLLGISQFFSPAAENGDRQLSTFTDQPLTASPYAWESLLMEDLAIPKVRFDKNESARKTDFELQQELLNSF